MDISEASRAELSNLLHSLSEKIGMRDRNQEMEREADRHFQAMRDSFRQVLLHGKNDVFVRQLMEQLQKVATIFAEASDKDIMRVTEYQFKSTQLLLEAFGTSKRVFRYTWRISPNERLFEYAAWR